jgi:uncharacterized protein (TIRG00374 family)
LKRILLSLFITAVILFVLLSQISLKDLFILLKAIDPLWAALGSATYLVSTLFRAFRFKYLIHSKNISFPDLFRITAFYHLSLMILPSKLGELSYPYFLNKIGGMNMTEGLASLIASRVYDFFIILMILLLALIGFQGLFKDNLFLVLLLVCLLMVLLFLAFFYMSSFLRGLSNVLGKISKGTPSINAKSILWVRRKMNEMAEDFYGIKARKSYLSVSLTSLLSWGMIFWTFYAFLRGFGIEVPFTKMVLGSTVAVIGNALPISGIGNWGTLEAGWTVGFLMVGLSKEKAITTGFGVHIIIFIVCAMMSFFCWVTLKKIKPFSTSPEERDR